MKKKEKTEFQKYKSIMDKLKNKLDDKNDSKTNKHNND